MAQRTSRARTAIPQSSDRPTTPTRRVRLMTTEQVRKSLNNTKIGAYIGTPGLPLTSLFYLGGPKGDILISALDHQELALRGVFQISRSECFLSPDGSYRPTNQFNSKFEDVKLSCKLCIPNNDDFLFMRDDLNAIMRNFKGFEALIDKANDDTCVSAVQMTGGWGTIKMCHSLFLKKIEDGNDEETLSENTEPSMDSQQCSLADELGEEFSMEKWPVSDRCKPHLEKLIAAGTHVMNPLRAYDIDRSPLPPKKYIEKLPGAIVLVSFALSHVHIKSSKRHIFNTICRELLVLREADELPSSPYKTRRFGAGPLLESDDEVPSMFIASSSSETLD